MPFHAPIPYSNYLLANYFHTYLPVHQQDATAFIRLLTDGDMPQEKHISLAGRVLIGQRATFGLFAPTSQRSPRYDGKNIPSFLNQLPPLPVQLSLCDSDSRAERRTHLTQRVPMV